jgi:hypothetical protein
MTLHVSIVSRTASSPYVRESLGCTLGYTGPICCDMPRGGWGRIISDCPLAAPTVRRVIRNSAEEVWQT